MIFWDTYLKSESHIIQFFFKSCNEIRKHKKKQFLNCHLSSRNKKNVFNWQSVVSNYYLKCLLCLKIRCQWSPNQDVCWNLNWSLACLYNDWTWKSLGRWLLKLVKYWLWFCSYHLFVSTNKDCLVP